MNTRRFAMKLLAIGLSILVLISHSTTLQAQTVPSSQRSREVVNRTAPRLKKELSVKGMTWGAPVFMRIFKQEKQLEVWLKAGRRFRLFKTYAVCTYGGMGQGPKTAQGDGRAPEGFYYVTPSQMNPFSHYYLAFNLGYPNAYDRLHGRTGGSLMVHGACVSIGCFAMTDKHMEEIYTLADAALNHGQRYFKVHIFPFRMTLENMKKNKGTRHDHFWREIKAGYDLFEAYAVPPDTRVQSGCYVFYKPEYLVAAPAH
jgi:murein L,D-transpeptidase YafK